jgi:prolipoprotein diacylglyceryltransferase
MALNMGQILSIPFILAGIALIVRSVANHKKTPDPADPVRRSRFYIDSRESKKQTQKRA